MTDGNVSDLFEKLNWKILVLILFGVFGLIMLMGNLANRSFESEIPKESSAPSPTKSEARTNSPSFPDTSLTTWKLYKTDQYEFTYPSDWKIEKLSISTWGELIRVNAEGKTGLNIRIEPFSKTESLAQKRAILTASGYTERKITFQNLEAYEFKNSSAELSSVRIYLSKRDKVYNFSYSYKDEELIFNRILSSFKFTPI